MRCKEKNMRPKKMRRVPKRAYRREPPMRMKRLYRSGRDKILGGVCGGIGEYLRIDPTIIRLIWVIAALVYGTGIMLYIILWIIIPRNPKDRWED